MTNPFRTSRPDRVDPGCIVVALCARSAGVGAQETSAASGQQESLRPRMNNRPRRRVPTGTTVPRLLVGRDRDRRRSRRRDGFYPEMGGHDSRRRLLGGPRLPSSSVRRAARSSTPRRRCRGTRYTTMQSQITWPRLLERPSLARRTGRRIRTSRRSTSSASAAARSKSDRTDYRLKNLDAARIRHACTRAVAVGDRPRRRAAPPGRSSRGTSTPDAVDRDALRRAGAPGLTEQPNYLHADVALDVDTRDAPGYPSQRRPLSSCRWRCSTIRTGALQLPTLRSRRRTVRAARSLGARAPRTARRVADRQRTGRAVLHAARRSADRTACAATSTTASAIATCCWWTPSTAGRSRGASTPRVFYDAGTVASDDRRR